MASRTFRHNDDNDELLQDGQVGRVRMMMRDSHTPARKPGFAYVRDVYARDEAEIAHYEHRQYLENAYRGGQRDASTVAEGAEGDSCTVSNQYFPEAFGSEGTIQQVDGVGLICCPNLNNVSAGDASPQDRAYRAYDAQLKNEWRRPPR